MKQNMKARLCRNWARAASLSALAVVVIGLLGGCGNSPEADPTAQNEAAAEQKRQEDMVNKENSQ